MRVDCDVIRDLLPLYAEDMVSIKSRELIETHFETCEDCRTRYQTMSDPAPKAEFTMEPAESFQKYVKKSKRRLVWRVALVTAIIVAALFIVRLIAIGGLVAFLMLDSALAPIEVDTDVNNYSLYIGENAKSEYRDKWGMDESIFPAAVTEDMDVKEYKMVYYNPWDAQYLSYLTVEYDDTAYAAELERLQNYTLTDYLGIYSVTGFSEEAPLLAMYADDYQGFVYAIATPGTERSVTYVEIIFCNYFMDLDYEEYMPAEYFPEGFDATMNNPYEEKMMAQQNY